MSLTQLQHGIAGLVVHPDGSIDRFPVPACDSDGRTSLDVDIQLPGSHSLPARIFFPKAMKGDDASSKFPLIVFFHGGGFVLFRADTFFYHELCEKIADCLEVIVLSVDYRLAPEHKLPAAFEDAVLALEWLQIQPCEALKHADLSRCFMMGDSAGANIVHNVAVRGHPSSLFLEGTVLLQPYFGGQERTRSESEMKDDKHLPLVANDMLWKLALPQGADRDDPACNPMWSETSSPSTSGTLNWGNSIGVLSSSVFKKGHRLNCSYSNKLRILVIAGGRDPMHDRQLRYVGMLRTEEENGQGRRKRDIKLVKYEAAIHGFFIIDKARKRSSVQQQEALLKILLEDLKNFVFAKPQTSKL